MHKTVQDIVARKNGTKISVVTSYDYSFAVLCDTAGIDILLVGDSAGMVMMGYDSTTQVTMEQMCMFTQGVGRGRKNALLVTDMPFMSYQTNTADAIANAGRLVKAGADAVKLEGGGKSIVKTIKAITEIGIPVMGHIGLQPQTSILSHGYRTQGQTAEMATRLIEEAGELEDAGAFSIVIEKTSQEAAKAITEAVKIPTIGIGAGNECDGQVLVLQDMLGMYDKVTPKFVKKYRNLTQDVIAALQEYKNDIETGKFPAEQNSYQMDIREATKLNDEEFINKRKRHE